MSLRCFLFGHRPEGWASVSGVFGASRCARCFEAVGGIRPEGTPRTIYAQPDAAAFALVTAKRTPTWWVRAVYERKSGT